MTLTVRLDTALASALERYSSTMGVSKSLVVQESLAVYLLSRQPQRGVSKAESTGSRAVPSANHKAFADAGLLAAGELTTGVPANKAAVRALATQRIRRAAG